MEDPLTLHLDNKPVKFTPDGKVSIIDAIGAVTNSERPRVIWETLKDDHPEVLTFCKDYSFQGKDPIPVVDSTGWEAISRYYFAMYLTMIGKNLWRNRRCLFK